MRVSGGGGEERLSSLPWGIRLALARPLRLAVGQKQWHLRLSCWGTSLQRLPRRPCEGVRRASEKEPVHRILLQAGPPWRWSCLPVCGGSQLHPWRRYRGSRLPGPRWGSPSQDSCSGLGLCPKLLCPSAAWALPPGSPPGNHRSQASLFLASWLYHQPCLKTSVCDALCHFLEESHLSLLQNGHLCDWSPFCSWLPGNLWSESLQLRQQERPSPARSLGGSTIILSFYLKEVVPEEGGGSWSTAGTCPTAVSVTGVGGYRHRRG